MQTLKRVNTCYALHWPHSSQKDELLSKFEKQLIDCLKKLATNKGKADACEWTCPEGEILDKSWIIEEGKEKVRLFSLDST